MDIDRISEEDRRVLLEAYRAYTETIRSRKNDDYQLNTAQWVKYLAAYDTLNKACTTVGGRIETEIEPRLENGGITAYLCCVDLCGDELRRFMESMKSACSLTIDATLKGEVCISLTIPGIFERKPR